jgi:hypothetical protein
MTAAALTGVYAEQIPNFEVMTLVVFASGLLLGARDGALVGALAATVYSLLNPYGPAHPLVMAAQAAGVGLAGVAGGVLARAAPERWAVGVRAAALGVIGALVTAAFDLLTNVATGVVYGQMKLVLIGGIPFALWHIATNVALFAALGTAAASAVAHYRSRLSV